MSWMRDHIGLDWFDLLVHGALTGLLMGFVSETGGGDPTVIAVAGGSILLLAVRRRWALRRRPATTGLTSGEMAAYRFEEMEQRLAELEAGQSRVMELEERLEFAERLLRQPSAEGVLRSGPKTGGEPVQ